MSAASFGYFLCAVLYPIVAVGAGRSNLLRLPRYLLIASCLATALSAGALFWGGDDPVTTIVGNGLDLLRGILWCGFFLMSLRVEERLWRFIRGQIVPKDRKGLMVALGITAGVLFFWLLYNSAAIQFSFLQIIVTIFTLLFIENLLRNCDESSLWGIRLLCIGAGLAATYDLFYRVAVITSLVVDPRYALARGYVQALGAPLILLAFAKIPRWRGTFVPSRHVVFHSAALAGAGFYLICTSLAGEYLRTHNEVWGTAFETIFLVTAVVTLMIVLQSASVRARLMVYISKHFFRLKYDYRAVWLHFIQRMARSGAPEDLHQRALHSVAEAIGCNGGILWTLQHSLAAYIPMATWNSEMLSPPMVPVDADLPQFMQLTSWIIDISQCQEEPDLYNGLTLPDWVIEQDNSWILIPLIHNQLMEGFIALGQPVAGTFPLGWEDLDLLKTLGAQVASYLAEERSSRELVDARRMTELNRRFAFVLHDIKNVVSQMDLMLQNTHRHGSNPDFQKDMLLTVANAVERLKQMLVQLGSERAPPRPSMRQVDLPSVVGRVAARWKKSYPDLVYRCDVVDEVMVQASEERLITVIDHLVQNALEAVEFSGAVKIALDATACEGLIEIIDDGPGMTREFISSQLFRPLETSKPNGSGIGAYQALKTIREMEGQLEVESHPGLGTTMRVRLARAKPSENEEKGALKHANSLNG